MTSLSCGVEALLRAAQFLEEQEKGQSYRPLENPKASTGKENLLFAFENVPGFCLMFHL